MSPKRKSTPRPPATPGTVGRNVRRMREAAGLSRAGLSRIAKVSTTAISSVELGYTQDMDPPQQRRIAAALGVTVAALEEETGTAETAAWLAAFEASPDARVLRPPLTGEERKWLLAIPSVTWGVIGPASSTLRVLIEDRRLRLAAGQQQPRLPRVSDRVL